MLFSLKIHILRRKKIESKDHQKRNQEQTTQRWVTKSGPNLSNAIPQTQGAVGSLGQGFFEIATNHPKVQSAKDSGPPKGRFVTQSGMVLGIRKQAPQKGSQDKANPKSRTNHSKISTLFFRRTQICNRRKSHRQVS